MAALLSEVEAAVDAAGVSALLAVSVLLPFLPLFLYWASLSSCQITHKLSRSQGLTAQTNALDTAQPHASCCGPVNSLHQALMAQGC